MKTRLVPSGWIEKEGRRLDCGPYLSGAIEAKLLLEKLPVPKEPLHNLTNGHDGGIYNGPQFVRNYVDDPAYGVPFLTSSSMLLADLSRVDLLRKRDALSPRLAFLRLRPGMTLISCSGTIGRMVYARADMDGVWSSQDMLKVIPDESKVLPGYLYAFLASRYGVPMIVGGTYGAIIQHIEPEHIANLPIPLLPIQDRIHREVESAARKRSEASRLITNATGGLLAQLDIATLPQIGDRSLSDTLVRSSKLAMRLDATYHSEQAIEAERLVRSAKCQCKMLPDVTRRLFKPPMFKRIWVADESYGRRFVSGQDIYKLPFRANEFVSSRTPNFDEFILKRGWVVFQAAGQVYGLFGRPIWVSGWLDGVFCADDVYRVVPHDEIDGAFLAAWFRTPHGRALLVRQASGNSIPRVWDPHMANVIVPWPERSMREEVAMQVISAHQLMDEAAEEEEAAIAYMEQQISLGGGE